MCKSYLSSEELRASVIEHFGMLRATARSGGQEAIFRSRHASDSYVEVIPLSKPTRLILNAGQLADGSMVCAIELPAICRLERGRNPADVRIVTPFDADRQLVFTVFGTNWVSAHVESVPSTDPPE